MTGDKLGEQAKDLMNTFNAQKDADKEKGKGDKGGDPDMSIGGAMEFDESLKALLGDKELLLGSIVASHENHGAPQHRLLPPQPMLCCHAAARRA